VFTGIVTHQGLVRRVAPTPAGLRLEVEPSPPLDAPTLGESVAVDGACLTLVAAAGGALAFDVVPETLRRTTLGALSPGDRVNLERALRLGDALGGHLVQGHVDAVARIARVEARGEDRVVEVRLPPELAGAVVEKGSVALAGVSLTVGETWEEDGETAFRVHLIPHTLAATTLGAWRAGARANVEADLLGRWVEHHLRRAGVLP
jgi:riboflavin synthase